MNSRSSTPVQGWRPSALASLLALVAPALGCSDYCDGRANGAAYCENNHIMQCRDWGPIDEGTCGSNDCRDVPGAGVSCVIPGLACPTATPGYQCMGEHRIGCYSDGSVVDYGSCSDEGPYCVENPGGEVRACGWKKEGCKVDGEVRCFDDGSAICRQGVYESFVSNAEAGQLVCDVTKLVGCWEGRTWCEGDVLKRCDRCLDNRRCAAVSVEATCTPGARAAYQPPGWLSEASPTLNSASMGCTVDAPDCVAGVTHTCQGEAPVFCAAPGVGVVAMSCAEIQSITGHVYGAQHGKPTIVNYGRYCVPGAGSRQALCVRDPIPCAAPWRCDPLDPTGTMLEYCGQDGYWIATESCNKPYLSPPTLSCQSGTPYDWCQ